MLVIRIIPNPNKTMIDTNILMYLNKIAEIKIVEISVNSAANAEDTDSFVANSFLTFSLMLVTFLNELTIFS